MVWHEPAHLWELIAKSSASAEWASDCRQQGASRWYYGSHQSMTGSALFATKNAASPCDRSATCRPIQIVIVRDMWLTGFDARASIPCISTKQCAARTHAGDRRVNRSSRKNRWPGRGLSWTAHELKAALATTRKRRQGSTASIGRGHRGFLREKYEISAGLSMASIAQRDDGHPRRRLGFCIGACAPLWPRKTAKSAS